MRASKLLHRILKFIIYANLFKINKNCYFSISQRILILFVLSDRAWWGLQNFYTELWNSLIMQIYANLFKISEKCHLSSIQKSQQICTSGGDVYYASRNLLSTCLFDCQCYLLQPELTAATMPRYLARQKPFVILFHAGDPISDKAANSLRAVATDENYDQFIPCQMDM